MTTNTEELKKLAQAATQGIWNSTNSISGTFIRTDATYEHPELVQPQDAIASVYGPDSGIANAAYISAANPAAVLELIDRYESLLTSAELAHSRLIASGGDSVSINALEKAIKGVK